MPGGSPHNRHVLMHLGIHRHTPLSRQTHVKKPFVLPRYPPPPLILSTQKLAADSSCGQTTSFSWSQASPSGPTENMLKAVNSDCCAVAEGTWDETAGGSRRQRIWQERLGGIGVAAIKHRPGEAASVREGTSGRQGARWELHGKQALGTLFPSPTWVLHGSTTVTASQDNLIWLWFPFRPRQSPESRTRTGNKGGFSLHHYLAVAA